MNARQVSDAVKNLAKQYKSVLDLGEYVAGIADLEAYKLELEKQRDKSLKEAQDAKESATALTAFAEEESKRLVQAREERNAILAGAKSAAAKVEIEAKERAEKAIEAADAEVNRVRLILESEVKAHDEFMNAAKAEEAEASARVEALKDEFAKLKAKLEG